ncbi:MAG: hypothetical protein EXQ71_07760 [Acidimicrobiia bacterium]|nr:hypothetical protein [Acidimicrobiia bacterium]
MELRPGLRLESTTCDTQVVVVKSPKEAVEIDLRCGGASMAPFGSGGDHQPRTVAGDAALLGKRYADDDLGLELLCTQGGEGPLSIGDEPLFIKGTKPLPSSD